MVKVVVLHSPVSPGSPPDEQDTMVQTGEIAEMLQRMGYETVPVPFGLNLEAVKEVLCEIKPRFVFNLVESVEGHDRFIYLATTLLEALNIPFTGSATQAVFHTTCKTAAKKTMEAAGIPTPPWILSDGRAYGNDRFPGTYIIKSVWDHASLALDQGSIVEIVGPEEGRNAIAGWAVQYGREFFAEKFIDGREFNLSVLGGRSGPVVLPPAEIRFDAFPSSAHRIVDYRAKWETGSFEFDNTPRSFDFDKKDHALIGGLERLALACWELFGMRGYARVDFRVDQEGRPWILEVNANPCISHDSGFIAAADRAGISFQDIVAGIIGETV